MTSQSTTREHTATATHTKRHPIRGLLWGIPFGLGLAFLAIGQGYAALGTLPPLLVLVAGIVVGTLWGMFAPAKQPKGEPPREPVETTEGTTLVAAASADEAAEPDDPPMSDPD